MKLAGLDEEGDLTAAQKREPRHKKPRDKWSLKEENIQESCSRYNHDNGERTGCPETPKDIAIRKPDITKNELLGKEALDDIRPRKQQDIDKEDTNDISGSEIEVARRSRGEHVSTQWI